MKDPIKLTGNSMTTVIDSKGREYHISTGYDGLKVHATGTSESVVAKGVASNVMELIVIKD